MCGQRGCYRQIPCYQRWAVDLFPEFQKYRISIARFECPRRRSTISLLPTQLIPYHQYTVSAVIGTLLLALQSRQSGQRGFYGAAEAVDPDSDVTPWLIFCWFMMAARGFERAHGILCRRYDFSAVKSGAGHPWAEVSAYLRILFDPLDDSLLPERVMAVVNRYSRQTRMFLFGLSSQQRL